MAGTKALVAAEVVGGNLHEPVIHHVPGLCRLGLGLAGAGVSAEAMAVVVAPALVIAVVVRADEVDDGLRGAQALARREGVLHPGAGVAGAGRGGHCLGHPEGDLLLLDVAVAEAGVAWVRGCHADDPGCLGRLGRLERLEHLRNLGEVAQSLGSFSEFDVGLVLVAVAAEEVVGVEIDPGFEEVLLEGVGLLELDPALCLWVALHEELGRLGISIVIIVVGNVIQGDVALRFLVATVVDRVPVDPGIAEVFELHFFVLAGFALVLGVGLKASPAFLLPRSAI